MKFKSKRDVLQGDLVLVDFSVYKKDNKPRPCVVISNNHRMNKNNNDGYFMVAPLYTLHSEDKVSDYYTHIPVRQLDTVDKQGVPRGTKDEYSYIAVEQSVSVPAPNLICKLGRLKGYKMGYETQVKVSLRSLF